MIRWKDLSINARIALCLIYAEMMIPKIKSMIEADDDAVEYSQGRQQMESILSLAWVFLSEKNKVDWVKIYRLSNENGYGYFDYIFELDDNNMLVHCIYYVMYCFLDRQKEENIPSDMELFGDEEWQEKMFSIIDEEAIVFISSEDKKKIKILKEKLYEFYPYNENDPYGKYIGKEEVFKYII